MDTKKLVEKLAAQIEREPYSYRGYEGHYSACKLLMKDSVAEAVGGLVWLSERITEAMPTMAVVNRTEMGALYGLHKEVLLAAAPYDLIRICSMWNGEGNRARSFLCQAQAVESGSGRIAGLDG